MTESFFNTIGLTGLDLQYHNRKNLKQEALVLDIFNHEKRELTAHWCWQIAKRTNPNIRENSIARSLTNLTNKGKLIKTDKMIKGNYGVANHLYKLA